MIWLAAAALALLNLLWLASNLLTLPGNWLMVLTTLGFAYLTRQHPLLSPAVLVAAVALAAVVEVAEFVSGMVGAKRGGSGKAGLVGAVVGGLLGGVVGTFVLPIPVIGSLAGICLGAGLGTYLVERQSGKASPAAIRSGTGAGLGRLAGTVVKFGIGAVIWIVVTVALIWP
jgi:uncharacterized protein